MISTGKRQLETKVSNNLESFYQGQWTLDHQSFTMLISFVFYFNDFKKWTKMSSFNAK